MQAQQTGARLSRRGFVSGIAGIGASAAGVALLDGCGLVPGRAPPKVPLIGYLGGLTATDPAQIVVIDGLRDGLGEHGLVEGRDLVIEFRFSEGQNERFPALTAELIGLGVRLIVCNGRTTTEAARRVTNRVPLVMVAAGDPVAAGFVASLARPGGNLTGATGFNVELRVKGIELLAAVAPPARRHAYLTNLSSPGEDLTVNAMTAAAKRLGLQLLVVDLRTQAEIEPAFEQVRAWGTDAVNVANTAPFNAARAAVVAQVARSRMPAISSHRAWVGDGLLMSFSDSERERGRAGARYVARILEGADPAELPIDQPSVFQVVVNRTTLANLGLTMPPDVAAQVTEWIE
jgi:putative ABC transport system substrate-binding protein